MSHGLQDREPEDVAARVRAGGRLAREDCVRLFQTADVVALGRLADLARQRRHGNRAYYTVNCHIDYSNICVLRSSCTFCAFARAGEEPGALCLSPEEVVSKAEALFDGRVAEFHIVGGLHPRLKVDYFEDMIRRLRARFPGVNLKVLTAVEVEHVARISRISVEECLVRLKDAGLGSLAGGGAEIFAERVRCQICEGKLSAEGWIDVMRTAHRLGIPSNATMLYGHIENAEDRADHLLRLRELQDETGGFLAFVPLPFQPLHNELGESVPHFTTGLDDLRMIAASRLILDNFAHVKAYWVMLGVKLAQVALNFGADDIDGTVMEEKISHDAGSDTPQGLSEQELVALIRGAGLTPVRRDSLYHPLSD